MPIYEYLCEACKTQIEVMQKYTDPAPTACESCGNGPMVKQLSLSSFALKGTGWYVTDFKGKPKATPSKDEGSSSGASSNGSDAQGGASSGTSEKPAAASSGTSEKPAGASKSSSESPSSSGTGSSGKSDSPKSGTT